ncbi:hypothetical protein D6789_02160, partial [Candidatus Woesearchaeota archaeon]
MRHRAEHASYQAGIGWRAPVILGALEQRGHTHQEPDEEPYGKTNHVHLSKVIAKELQIRCQKDRPEEDTEDGKAMIAPLHTVRVVLVKADETVMLPTPVKIALRASCSTTQRHLRQFHVQSPGHHVMTSEGALRSCPPR